MSDTQSATKIDAGDAAASADRPSAPPKKDENFFSFLFWLVLGVVVLRSFIVSPFNIPSESMLPRLLTGDYLFATKWSYGYSKYSLPFSVPLIPGRIFASQPERGDVAIFKAPPGNDVDYIKRVIGLPGDEIQVKAGQLFINGTAVPKVKVADFVVPVSPNTDCERAQFQATLADGSEVCRYPQFRETLPNGVSYTVLDLGDSAGGNPWGIDADNTQAVIVPEGHLFLMGDNRDNSMDSRFPAAEGGGIGMVPQENLVGKAAVMMFSTDGSSEWIKPWTWFTAARWSRIGSVI
ncbi:signal peptidase I [Novosphingobium soli]|uniref:Signal peptidase I n=1 Tax=Novosphingobium soli TaxID=574956 RepID=A0ABV6CSV5_9SPHN